VRELRLFFEEKEKDLGIGTERVGFFLWTRT
jgi:hypothetical protein